MTLLKHILVVIALLVAAMPCCHAVGHGEPVGNTSAEESVDASHACDCHSCDENALHHHVEMPQELIVSPDVIDVPPSSIQLLIFSETKPLKQLVPPAGPGVLASIQTVQLLI